MITNELNNPFKDNLNDLSTTTLLDKLLSLNQPKVNQPLTNPPKRPSVSKLLDQYMMIEISENDADCGKKTSGLKNTPTVQTSHPIRRARRPNVTEIQILYQLTIQPFLPVVTSSRTLSNADTIYRKVMSATDCGPAILHKLRDGAFLSWDLSYPDTSWDELRESGRVYPPPLGMHNWALNSVWMLAHIHKLSQFMIISPVITPYIMREVDVNHYSAFSKEIVVAMKAGYEITLITYQEHQEVIYLSPTKPQEQAVNMVLTDCMVDTRACQRGIQQFQEAAAKYRDLTNVTPLSGLLGKVEKVDYFDYDSKIMKNDLLSQASGLTRFKDTIDISINYFGDEEFFKEFKNVKNSTNFSTNFFKQPALQKIPKLANDIDNFNVRINRFIKL